MLIVLSMLGPVSAQECPSAQSVKKGFVVERGDEQKTEVFHDEGGIVRTITRYNGIPVLETTQYEGLFQLDRLDNGRRTRFEAQLELKQLFPLKPGRNASAAFVWESDGRTGQLQVDIAVKREDALYIGPCKYAVLKIERSESASLIGTGLQCENASVPLTPARTDGAALSSSHPWVSMLAYPCHHANRRGHLPRRFIGL